jgi:hypothetical protein
MHIRSTIDPISANDVVNPETHPCLYEGDGENGVEVYFESAENLRAYQSIEVGGHKVIEGNSSADYVAEG